MSGKGHRNDQKMFLQEWELYDHFMELDETISKEQMFAEMKQLTSAYGKILRQIQTITRVGDSNHRKLIRAREEKNKTLALLEKKNENLMAAQRRLVMKEKMAALGALTAGVAHEISNPLNFINNFSRIILQISEELEETCQMVNQKSSVIVKEILEDLEDIKEGAELIIHHGDRAGRIVQNMTMLVRERSGQPQLLDLNSLLEQYMRQANELFEQKSGLKNVKIQMDLDPDLPHLEVIPQDMGCVFMQLATNALEALWDRTRLEQDIKPTIILASKNCGDHVELAISDNGIGIKKGDLSKIFTPFFTTKPPGQGNIGFGLALAFEIVSHGYHGDLKVVSKPKEFTRFKIILPKGVDREKIPAITFDDEDEDE